MTEPMFAPGVLLETKERRSDEWELVPATISFCDILTTNTPLVVVDGDSEPIPAIQLIPGNLTRGDRVWVQRVPPSGVYIVSRAVNSGYVFSGIDAVAISTASTTYVASSRSQGVVFVAPTGGVVQINMRSSVVPSAGAEAWMSVRIGEGSSIGSGTVFQAASDSYALLVALASGGGDWGMMFPITGLTPGRVYNAQLQHRTSAGTSFWARRQIMVDPK